MWEHKHRKGLIVLLTRTRAQQDGLVVEYDLVDGGLLVTGTGHDVLVVVRDVAREH